MLKYFLLIGLFFPNPESQAADLCSPLNNCVLEKKTWQKTSWKLNYSHEISFDKFCGHNRPRLQAEKELGLELWIFPGDAKSKSFKKEPYVTLNLHTYKPAHVVASASAPVTATAVNFTHRLQSRGNTVIEVSCEKKPTNAPKESPEDSASAPLADLTK